MKILDRYLVRELAWPFIVGAVGFVLIWLGNNVYEVLRLTQGKVSYLVVARLIVLYAPYALVFGLPFSMLLSTALALNRLGKDSELTALRMAGISLKRLVAPAFIIGLLVSGIAFANAEYLVPWANHAAANLVRRTLLRQPFPLLREHIFFRAGPNHYVYIGRINPETQWLQRVMIYELTPQGYPIITTARTAYYREEVWHLFDGIQHVYGEDGFSHVQDRHFGRLTINLRRGLDKFWGEQKTPLEMSTQELGQQIATFDKSGIDVRDMKLDYHFKFSLPFACLIVAMLAAPLAIKFSRAGSFVGLLVAFILAFLYQVLMAWSRILGQAELLPPVLAAWSQNFIFAGLGILLLWWEE